MFSTLSPMVTGALIGTIVALFVAIWLSLVYWRSKTVPVKYLMIFFWMKVIFLGGLTLGYFVIPDSPVAGLYLIKTAMGVLHFTLIPLVLLASYFWFPKQRKLFVWIVVIGGLIAFVLSLLQPVPSAVGTAALRDMIGAFATWYANISHLFTMTAIGLALFVFGLKSGNIRLILRGIFLGLGMALASESGNFQLIAPVAWLAMLGQLNAIGHIAMGVGMAIHPRRE